MRSELVPHLQRQDTEQTPMTFLDITGYAQLCLAGAWKSWPYLLWSGLTEAINPNRIFFGVAWRRLQILIVSSLEWPDGGYKSWPYLLWSGLTEATNPDRIFFGVAWRRLQILTVSSLEFPDGVYKSLAQKCSLIVLFWIVIFVSFAAVCWCVPKY